MQTFGQIAPKKEFRGVWVATVVNIDWPNNGNDLVEKQQADFIKILDFYKQLNFNAVIVQIRTAGDAFYPTQLAPWSRFLTGKEGKAPYSNYDPLQWMVDETHKRGLEFHAWLNPYRATFDNKTEVLSTNHDFYKHRNWMIGYGKKYYYNPGLPQVQEHLKNIVMEVVEKYPVDAIHFDDYFYPYKVKGETFNDAEAFKQYASPGQSLENWRRANVDSLIKKIHLGIKQAKPQVQFGISPFGVWRNVDKDPMGSDSKAGQTNYDDLYADPLVWIKNGWIDYIVPQLYWSLDHPLASHRKLLNWWSEHSGNVKLYVGNGPYKIRNNEDGAWNNPMEIPNQIRFSRSTPNVSGNVFFSAKSLMQNNDDVVQILKDSIYQFPSEELFVDQKATDTLPKAPQETITRAEAPQLIKVYENNAVLTFEIQLKPTLKTNETLLFYFGKKPGKLEKYSGGGVSINRDQENILYQIPKRALKRAKFFAFSVKDETQTEHFFKFTLNQKTLNFKKIP